MKAKDRTESPKERECAVWMNMSAPCRLWPSIDHAQTGRLSILYMKAKKDLGQADRVVWEPDINPAQWLGSCPKLTSVSSSRWARDGNWQATQTTSGSVAKQFDRSEVSAISQGPGSQLEEWLVG